MGEETTEKKVKTANIGDVIQISKGIEKGKKGKVVVLRENSVIAEIGKNKKTDEPIKTVVNHKNYKLVK
ncbi:YkvS family protein [Mesobacillus maritimus]|uniref:DUF2187 family protein n=1 Tax=Mesobacillus maritimus TaxID=1643336 RepID=UPI00203F9F46|nr:DUF2187 family protein [Mesobacillus maritimus]MCM3586704.1 YkvS family protein [Mesobacillus maritimus]